MHKHRVTLPDGTERVLEAEQIHSHAVVDELDGGFVVTWHVDEQAALASIAWHSAAVLVPLWQCDNCDVFDDTTAERNGTSMGDTSQCDTCIAEVSAPYLRRSR